MKVTHRRKAKGAPHVIPQETRGKAGPARSAAEARRFRRPRLAGRHGWYQPVKRAVEVVGVLILAVLALPVVLLTALVVKLTSRGPAFYSQTRVGRDAVPFTIYKVRTMIHNCESLTGPRWSIPGDPRITRVGQVLRLTHLDELPQLWNVLRGDMSLIGPRPERPEFVRELERAIPGYRDRQLVRPGVTGLAQVQLDSDTGLDSVRRKLAYDLYYIDRFGPGMDLRILGATALHVVGLSFGLVRMLFAIPTGEAVEASLKATVSEAPGLRVHQAACICPRFAEPRFCEPRLKGYWNRQGGHNDRADHSARAARPTRPGCQTLRFGDRAGAQRGSPHPPYSWAAPPPKL
jgi:lipopolysaccharide/colanic/teichoic acid biosynthesis glycosyltransferase